MTYTIFRLFVNCDDENTLKLIASKHAEVSARDLKGSFHYETSFGYFGGATLKILPEWQETEDDYIFGFNSLMDQCFEELWCLNFGTEVELSLQMDVMHDGQCNLELASIFASKLSNFKQINLLISCYENPDLVEEMQNKLSLDGRA